MEYRYIEGFVRRGGKPSSTNVATCLPVPVPRWWLIRCSLIFSYMTAQAGGLSSQMTIGVHGMGIGIWYGG
jgi:hypothetical protein